MAPSGTHGQGELGSDAADEYHDLSVKVPAVLSLTFRQETVHFAGEESAHLLENETDYHDDTPLLRKLLILAANPRIASCVQILEHRCHLPPAGIFNELPKTPLNGGTLSCDSRTVELVKRATLNLERIHTLRIIFGHPNLNDALLRCLFSRNRIKQAPIRRLWLEDCRLSAGCDLHMPHHPLGLPRDLDFAGLESLRFRRMPIKPAMADDERLGRFEFNHCRGLRTVELQDGQGGLYLTTANQAAEELRAGSAEADVLLAGESMPEMLRDIFAAPMKWDDQVFKQLDKDFGLPDGLLDAVDSDVERRARTSWRGQLIDPAGLDHLPEPIRRLQRERLPSSTVAISLLSNVSATLTSICFDWVLAMPYNLAIAQDSSKQVAWLSLHADLFALRFPSLRAFQYRNAVVVDTILPPGLFLLDHAGPMERRSERERAIPEALQKRLDLACLKFMEAHPNLQCLAWPMEGFFANHTKSDIVDRVRSVVDNLGRTLVDLRVDTMYSSSGERQSDNSFCDDPQERDRRRRFISDFAAKMTKVESIKLEGGVPRDERRETLRALHRCPVNKVVLIGVCSPIGNTWGEGGGDLMTVGQTLDVDEITTLEAEHKDAIHRLGYTKPEVPSPDFTFQPSYGWPASPPMIHTIASHHASTITELKFCGYKGAPALFEPTPITAPLLAPLKHFHNLRTLIMSFCLLTRFEGDHRDQEIIRYWLDSRSPTTTSLMRIVAPEDMGGWERELNTRYAPKALAAEVVKQLGPALSEMAKGRRGGVHVRASMCLGDWGGIFDIDVKIGKDGVGGDVCLGFEGPRGELEEERRRGKLEGRRWF